MGNRFSPGGCKCCGCVADSTHVCICDCPTPFDRFASVADAAGAYAFNYSFGAWTTSSVTINVSADVWDVGGTDCGPGGVACRSAGTALIGITYSLVFNCAARTWTMGCSWKYVPCKDPVSCVDVKWPTKDLTSNVTSVSDTIAIDCSNTSMLAFNLPTTHADGYPTPGGGGAITVVF